MHWEYVILLSNIKKRLDVCIVACLIPKINVHADEFINSSSYYTIGAKGRYLYLWVLAGSGYLWVAGNPYEMRGGCG